VLSVTKFRKSGQNRDIIAQKVSWRHKSDFHPRDDNLNQTDMQSDI